MRLLARLVGLFLLMLSGAAHAQDFASLLADHVRIDENRVITADGNVEVIFGDVRLQAATLSYDGRADTLTIKGPIILTDEDGQTTILADAAELDAGLRDGILTSARLVLDDQLQLAAAQIVRAEGRYTQLSRTVASSCRVCAGSSVPLWQIRANKVIHDQQEKRLYFEQAVLEIAGLPVFYVPRLRVPDPTETRATGFLIPSIRNSTLFGTTFRFPYFITLGDHADLTLRPIISPQTRTLGFKYRRAFANGSANVTGAFSNDDLRPDENRLYIFAEANLALAREFDLAFDIELVSDADYLAQYEFTSKTSLDSGAQLTRFRRNSRFIASATQYRTIRGSDLGFADRLPQRVAEARYDRALSNLPFALSGVASVSADLHSRPATGDVIGRDVARLGGQIDLSHRFVTDFGFETRVGGGLKADIYGISSDSNHDEALLRAFPYLEAELRYPLIRNGANGATWLVEPILHFAYAGKIGDDPPNEDSRLTELGLGNVFSVSRFAGDDRFENGASVAAGLSASRVSSRNVRMSFDLAQVWRSEPSADFTASSGLGGGQSDWLLGARIETPGRLNAETRALIASDGSLTTSETRFDWTMSDLQLSAAHSWQVADPANNRDSPVSEYHLAGSYRFLPSWQASARYDYDRDLDQATRGSLDLTYMNECLRMNLSLSRRFRSSASIVDDTAIGVEVALLGFGGGETGPMRACTNEGQF